jgi:hypothetical protein
VYLMERSPLDEIAELLIQVQSSRYLIGRVTTVKYTELAMIFLTIYLMNAFAKW